MVTAGRWDSFGITISSTPGIELDEILREPEKWTTVISHASTGYVRQAVSLSEWLGGVLVQS